MHLSQKTVWPAVLLLSIGLLGGCASRRSLNDLWVHPELPYLQDRPYRRLYVEVDRMEGADFPNCLVDELKGFLGRYCLKPDGIEVVLDPPLPLSEFQDIPLNAASILCMDGPRVEDGRPAYLHLFVYDSKTVFKKGMRNPRTAFTGGPPGVFWNVDYARFFPNAAKSDMLRHELGHVLGLCRSTVHGDGSHCRKDICLMHWTPDWLSQLGGVTHLYYKEHRLCQDCERDLAAARQTPRDDALSFAGPFLLRRADGYCVASVPFYDTIILAPTPAEFDWRKALRQAKANIGSSLRDRPDNSRRGGTGHGGIWVSLYDRPKKETDPQRLRQDIAALSKAVNDPSPIVRRLAPALLKTWEDALREKISTD